MPQLLTNQANLILKHHPGSLNIINKVKFQILMKREDGFALAVIYKLKSHIIDGAPPELEYSICDFSV